MFVAIAFLSLSCLSSPSCLLERLNWPWLLWLHPRITPQCCLSFLYLFLCDNVGLKHYKSFIGTKVYFYFYMPYRVLPFPIWSLYHKWSTARTGAPWIFRRKGRWKTCFLSGLFPNLLLYFGVVQVSVFDSFHFSFLTSSAWAYSLSCSYHLPPHTQEF